MKEWVLPPKNDQKISVTALQDEDIKELPDKEYKKIITKLFRKLTEFKNNMIT